jgi:hypothetical protein
MLLLALAADYRIARESQEQSAHVEKCDARDLFVPAIKMYKAESLMRSVVKIQDTKIGLAREAICEIVINLEN